MAFHNIPHQIQQVLRQDAIQRNEVTFVHGAQGVVQNLVLIQPPDHGTLLDGVPVS